MCGIAGFINFYGHQKDIAFQIVRKMSATLVHRGPDEEGFFVNDYIALGHRRLSIIDLGHGQQPMAASNEWVKIVFNGEIYNFMDIRRELSSRGHLFKTHCDTEVILQAYLEWGESCVEKLNGMFAFALWDERDRKVLLARDRVGKKPLYYVLNKGMIAFASELKALLAGGMCKGEVDHKSLDCYLSLGYIPAPRAIFTDVKKLSAGHYMIVRQNEKKEKQYWRLKPVPSPARTLIETTEEFSSILDEAVKCRLMSEVPLGCFLSGGLDSSLVLSSMAKVTNSAVTTNSIGFHDRNFNELPIARLIAEHFGTNHHEVVVTPKILDVLEKIAWIFDEPFADSSAVPTWYVCQMARKNVTVALSGDGGDESFGGYTFRYVPHMMESKIRARLPLPMRKLTFGIIGRIWPSWSRLPKYLRLKTIFENLTLNDSQAFYNDLVWLRNDNRNLLYSQDFKQALDGFNPYGIVRRFYEENEFNSALERSQYTDLHVYLTEDVLVKVDRMSMAHSLEVRSPLLDYRIIEFAAGLSEEHKIKKSVGKQILRKLAAERLPRNISTIPKTGFSIPAARWLRNDLKEIARDAIFKSRGIISVTLEKMTLERIWKEHQSGYTDHSVSLWGLMMLSLWEHYYYR
jgi:asparagine synthase (glutamine-hydrolysing)